MKHLSIRVKSTWNPPKRVPAVELLLNQTEKDILSILPGKATNYNLSNEEYLTMLSLQMAEASLLNQQTRGPLW